jgi:hypothetical protein
VEPQSRKNKLDKDVTIVNQKQLGRIIESFGIQKSPEGKKSYKFPDSDGVESSKESSPQNKGNSRVNKNPPKRSPTKSSISSKFFNPTPMKKFSIETFAAKSPVK